MSLRLKAFLVHLSLSAVIGLLVLLLVFGLWYPAPLHIAVGVTHIFLLLLLIDVVLGPLLTVLVCKVGKKTLVFDFAVIALLQLSALGYGLWAVAEGRPAWLVFNVDRFDLVRVLDIDARRLNDARPEYKYPSWFGPLWVAAVKPKDIEDNNTLVLEAALGGSDIPQRPNLYQPLADHHKQVKGRLRSLTELQKFNSIDDVRIVTSRWPESNAWLPLMAPVPMVVLFRKETAEVIAVVDLRPWL